MNQTTNVRRPRALRVVLTLAGAMALSGLIACSPSQDSANAATPTPASTTTTTSSPTVELPKTLADRAEHYWAAAAEDDWTTLYEYRDPRDREKATLKQFAEWSETNEPFQTKGYVIHEILEDERAAWVRLTQTSSMRKFPGTPTREIERWHVWRPVNGDWYPVPLLEMESYPVTPAMRNLSEEPRLRARFDESWAARQNEDWERLYALGDPRDRAEVPFNEFVGSYEKSRYVECEVFWVEAVEDRGRVRIRFSHKLKDPSLTKLPPKIVIAWEEWALVDGDWYLDLVKK